MSYRIHMVGYVHVVFMCGIVRTGVVSDITWIISDDLLLKLSRDNAVVTIGLQVIAVRIRTNGSPIVGSPRSDLQHLTQISTNVVKCR